MPAALAACEADCGRCQNREQPPEPEGIATDMDAMDSLGQIEALLADVTTHLKAPTKAARRAAALKLDRIVAIASTLSATVHTVR